MSADVAAFLDSVKTGDPPAADVPLVRAVWHGLRGDWEAVDPFLALMEDWFPRGVFDKHPHRGIETVTYVLEGRIDHYDNHGHEGAILPGEAQWMTAGRGLIHNEIPAEGATFLLKR